MGLACRGSSRRAWRSAIGAMRTSVLRQPPRRFIR